MLKQDVLIEYFSLNALMPPTLIVFIPEGSRGEGSGGGGGGGGRDFSKYVTKLS